MKKNIIHFLLITGICFSCDNKSPIANEEVSAVAYAYCVAAANYNLDTAEVYCTPETIRTTIHKLRVILPHIDSAYIASDTPAEIKIETVKLTSDTTAYAIYKKTTPIRSHSDTINLRLRDGRWFVHFQKER